MSLSDKEWSARKRFEGKKVRRIFSTKRYSECVRVRAHGQPSGWYVIYELELKNRGRINVERMSEVEIKPQH